MLLFSLGVVVSVELSVACNIHIVENEVAVGLRCFHSTRSSFIFNFPANGQLNLEILQHKTICTPRGIIPQNFSLRGFSGQTNKHTHTHIHKLTDIPLLWKKDYYIPNLTYFQEFQVLSNENTLAQISKMKQFNCDIQL